MTLELYIFVDFFDMPLRIDNERCAQHTHKLLALSFPFAPHPQRPDQLALGICQ